MAKELLNARCSDTLWLTPHTLSEGKSPKLLTEPPKALVFEVPEVTGVVGAMDKLSKIDECLLRSTVKNKGEVYVLCNNGELLLQMKGTHWRKIPLQGKIAQFLLKRAKKNGKQSNKKV